MDERTALVALRGTLAGPCPLHSRAGLWTLLRACDTLKGWTGQGGSGSLFGTTLYWSCTAFNPSRDVHLQRRSAFKLVVVEMEFFGKFAEKYCSRNLSIQTHFEPFEKRLQNNLIQRFAVRLYSKYAVCTSGKQLGQLGQFATLEGFDHAPEPTPIWIIHGC